MDAGDIIYFIILLFFLMLGLFNKSGKGKEKKEQEIENDHRSKTEEMSFPPSRPKSLSERTIKRSASSFSPLQRQEYESPLLRDSIAFREGESMLNGSVFVEDSTNMSETDVKSAVHPLIKELYSDRRTGELRKAMIYGEIFGRKF